MQSVEWPQANYPARKVVAFVTGGLVVIDPHYFLLASPRHSANSGDGALQHGGLWKNVRSPKIVCVCTRAFTLPGVAVSGCGKPAKTVSKGDSGTAKRWLHRQ